MRQCGRGGPKSNIHLSSDVCLGEVFDVAENECFALTGGRVRSKIPKDRGLVAGHLQRARAVDCSEVRSIAYVDEIVCSLS